MKYRKGHTSHKHRIVFYVTFDEPLSTDVVTTWLDRVLMTRANHPIVSSLTTILVEEVSGQIEG